MLTHIEIEGFRSLRHVDLDLPGLTVLIGANNSGKSNLLDVFSLMSESAAGQLREGMDRRGGFFKLFFRDIGNRSDSALRIQSITRFGDSQPVR